MADHRDYLLSCIEELPPFRQQIMDALGAFIHTYPEQWSMFRPMWPRAGAR